MIKWNSPKFDGNEIKYVTEVLNTGYVSEGPFTKKLEEELKKVVGTKHIIMTTSATAALYLAIEADKRIRGYTEGEVIIPTTTFCLDYYSRVQLPNGKTEKIGKIVNNKQSIEVLSLNLKTNKIEPKKITNWFKLPVGGSEWYRICLKNSRRSRLCGSYGTFITGNHEVLTKTGYKRVDRLTQEDMVATNQIRPNSVQEQVIIGSLLGDASISLSRKTYSRFTYAQSLKQKEWFEIKLNSLKGFNYSIRESENCIKKVNPIKKYKTITAETQGQLYWRELRNKWYPKGKKVVPDDLVLTPLTLATWYMDDGSFTNKDNAAIFCTDGFGYNSFWKLFYKLVDLGLTPTAFKNGKGYRIRIGNDINNSANKFFEMIAPYITPKMRYKLPKNSKPFDPSLWDLGVAEIDYGEVIVEKKSPAKTNTSKYMYCLEVEDNHNFFAADMVVSNCATKNAVELANLIPCIKDVNKDNFILSSITDNPKTKITCVVNLLGRKSNLVGNNSYIKELNEETGYLKNISRSTFIYDNAGCLGSKVPNGKVGCYSLQANKIINCGQGGFCATDDDEYAKVIRQLKDFGREDKYQNNTTGFNFKFNDIQAAVALAQLEKLDERRLLHINQYNYYKEELSEYGKFVEYRIGEDLRDTEVPLWVEFITDKRDELYYYLLSKGIECREPWKCLIEDEKKYPNSKFYQDNVLWLPNGSSLTLLEQTEVIKNIKGFFLGLFSQK